MLQNLVNVATVNCETEAKLCEKLGSASGTTVFYPKGQVKAGKGTVFGSLDAKELAMGVLEMLPDMIDIKDTERFESLREGIKVDEEPAWLIQFVGAELVKDLELRKLPAMLKEIKVGKVNCTKMPQVCKDFFIHKYPTYAIFKKSGGYEIHHGKLNAHDIASFAKECANNNVQVLRAQDLQRIASSRSESWMVDFFTPWCPPCMRLLPEFRKASKKFADNVRFGTIDCTVLGSTCQQFNVRSYPTSIFYNQSQPHSFVGLHSAAEIVEFIKDVLKPPVVDLTPTLFATEVLNKAPNHVWVVDFFAPWCGPCQELAPEWRKLAKMLKDTEGVSVGQVDCVRFSGLCQENAVHSYPTMRLYKAGAHNLYVDYRNWFRDAPNLRHWVLGNLPSHVEDLTADQFLHDVLNSEEPWVIDFFAPWCGHCHAFAPEYEAVARTLKEQPVRFGKINCDHHYYACQSAGIQAYPTLRLYAGVRRKEQTQNAYGKGINSLSSRFIIDFLKRELGLDETTAEQARSRDEL